MEMMSKESYIDRVKDLCINDLIKEKEILKCNILNNVNLFFDNKETKRDIELEYLDELNKLIDKKVEKQEIDTYGKYISVIHEPFQSAYGKFDDLIINRQNEQKTNYIIQENKIIDLVKFKINIIEINEEFLIVKFEDKKNIKSASSNPDEFNKEFLTDFKTIKIFNNVEYKFNLEVYDASESWKCKYINIVDINKVIKQDMQDPFFADILIKYFNELNISNGEIVEKYNTLKSNEKVLNDFIKYIVKRNFDFDTNLTVNGKTAKQIFNENPRMNGLDVYLNLINGNNDKNLYKCNNEFSIKVTEKSGIPTKQFKNTRLYINNDDIIIDNKKLNKNFNKIELLNIINRALPKLQEIKQQQTEEFLIKHICCNNSIKQIELTIKDQYMLLNMQTSTGTDKFLRALVNELIQLIYN